VTTSKGKYVLTCVACGKSFCSIKQINRGMQVRFCSRKCAGSSRRTVQDQDEFVDEAIRMRLEGHNWRSIAGDLKHSPPHVQILVWMKLAAVKMLTPAVVRSIWFAAKQAPTPAWGGLERTTGLYCTEAGGTTGPAYNEIVAASLKKRLQEFSDFSPDVARELLIASGK
jgi:hypothetical protein